MLTTLLTRASIEAGPKKALVWLASVPRDPYAVDTHDFLAELKQLCASPKANLEWTVHGPLEAARWGRGAPIRLMVVGQLHAREMYTAELVKYLMVRTIEAASGDRSRGEIDWLFVPIANPCGRDLVAAGYREMRAHHQNASLSWQACRRTNCRGVDLNRNWVTEYGMLHDVGDSSRNHWQRAPEDNPGNYAFSENETSALRLLLHDFAPHLLLNVHTGTLAVGIPPEDGSKQGPVNLANIRLVMAWVLTRSRCCEGSTRLGSISQGSMTDYAWRRIATPVPLTLEVYRSPNASATYAPSPPEYVGKERWGDSAENCFWFFNPPQRAMTEVSAPWLRLWRALFYLNGTELEFIKKHTDYP